LALREAHVGVEKQLTSTLTLALG